ncbi:MAG: hypothetical protein WBD25_16510 [Terriglobales bacterium]
MRNPRHSCSSPVMLASVFLVAIIMVSCNQTKETAPATQPQLTTPATQQVFVIFEGPWAFAPDPKDANSVIAMAPKTTRHRDLFIQRWDKQLGAGVYDLSMPARSGSPAGTLDPNILRVKIDAAAVQHVLDTKLVRYAIRLPKPEAYVAAAHFRSRADSKYPPDVSTEKDWVTSTSLRYTVTTLNGFSLTGSPDTGTFSPLPLQVETPIISFAIAPAHDGDAGDRCHTHSRGSFHDVTTLLNLTLFVDFPDDPSDCRTQDPQNSRSAKAEVDYPSTLEQVATWFEWNQGDVQEASVASASIAPGFLNSFIRGSAASLKRRLLAAAYFSGGTYGNCAGPQPNGGG